MEIPGRIPSWNALLGMTHWKRIRAKKEQQENFISALSLGVNDSATRTILASSGCSTVSDIVARLREMSRKKSTLKSRSEK